MTLIDTIKKASLEARKARDAVKAASLSTLIGEIETAAKAGRGGLDDANVVAVVKKFIKNIDDSLTSIGRTGAFVVDSMLEEKALYEQFLPKQLTEEELDSAIDNMIVLDGAKNIGEVMKLLKLRHAGTYDGGLASKLLKTKF